jgi:hypothetical protein
MGESLIYTYLEAGSPFKHECHTTFPNLLRFQVCIAGLFVALRVRPMSTHDIVQTRACWPKSPTLFSIVISRNQSHELGHHISVVPWWTECTLGHEPARRENHEIRYCRAYMVRGTSENSEDRRVRMIERDAPDDIEPAQIIFIRIVIPVPSDDVEHRVVLSSTEERVVKFADHTKLRAVIHLGVVKICSRRLEVSCIGKAIRANGSKLRKLEVTLVQLANITSYWSRRKGDTVSTGSGFMNINI